uniref:Uncharacterized protein n=1 Tax=Ananas comosus var. bracteatus TaxID=296719 RepID=A0A6V7NKR4_ANACO|nr:unnamed protein product [Ananas comosus var. bracteatus]
MDIYDILIDIIQKPYAYGFEEATRGCCGTGEIEVTLLCNSITAPTCPDDTKFVSGTAITQLRKLTKSSPTTCLGNTINSCLRLSSNASKIIRPISSSRYLDNNYVHLLSSFFSFL